MDIVIHEFGMTSVVFRLLRIKLNGKCFPCTQLVVCMLVCKWSRKPAWLVKVLTCYMVQLGMNDSRLCVRS